jgi:hypothetical protein
LDGLTLKPDPQCGHHRENEKTSPCGEFENEPIRKCYGVWTSGKQLELRREGLLQGSLEPPSGRN